MYFKHSETGRHRAWLRRGAILFWFLFGILWLLNPGENVTALGGRGREQVFQTQSRTPIPPSPTRCQPSVPNGWVAYQVRPGDTLYALAQRSGTTLSRLLAANCLPGTGSYIRSGQLIYLPSPPPTPRLTLTATAPRERITDADEDGATPTITSTPPPTPRNTNTPVFTPSPTPRNLDPLPPPTPRLGSVSIQPTACAPAPPADWTLYQIQPGDTLSALAQASGTSALRLQQVNCLSSDLIRSGQRIWTPAALDDPSQAQPVAATSVPEQEPVAQGAAPNCTEQVRNGDFDTESGWVRPRTASQARVVNDEEDAPYLLLGIPPGQEGPATLTYSSAYQRDILLPASASVITLTLDYRSDSSSQPGDRLVRLYRKDGRLLQSLSLPPSADWQKFKIDITDHRGWYVRLFLQVTHPGGPDPHWMAVDNIHIQACP